MESSRRDLLNNVAEHRPILKNDQTSTPAFNFTPKTGKAFPETGFFSVNQEPLLITRSSIILTQR